MKTVSRKEFLKSAAMLSAGGVLAAGSFASAEKSLCSYADTIAWDGVYDVVVMGMGAAGCSAATYAAKAGAGVLLFDVAPEWEAGGNSRYCAQFCFIALDKEGVLEKNLTYYKATYGEHPYDEELLKALIRGQIEIPQEFVDTFGCDPEDIVVWSDVEGNDPTATAIRNTIPEFPEFPHDKSTMDMMSVGRAFSNSRLYKTLQRKVYNTQNIDVWFNARGSKLIQEPETGTVIGIEIEKDGETRKIRALNGVVMACGGFENNRQMASDYLGLPVSKPYGTVYNRGDGHRMALEINADLWHMGCYESAANFCYAVDVGNDVNEHIVNPAGFCSDTGFYKGSFILVGADGSRFMNETYAHRHGHKYVSGEWKILHPTTKAYLIFDSLKREELRTVGLHTGVEEMIVEAASIEELAVKLGIADPTILVKAVTRYNGFAIAGEDQAFDRNPATMLPVAEAPFYAIPLIPAMLNTQGGPRRNADAQIVDVNGDPIPHLYSAGEFGGLTGGHYQGATNIAECLVFGRYAGTNAAAPKEALPEIEAEAVVSDIRFTVGSGSSEVPGERVYELAENEYIGTSKSGIGGDIDVKLTMDGEKILSVEIVHEHETKGYGSAAVKELPGRILEAQSVGVDNVAGATVTSGAIKEAVLDALAKAK